jgi:hypothetical protein
MSWMVKNIMARNAEVLGYFGERQLVHAGESRTLREWAQHFKIQPYTMAERIMKMRRGVYTPEQVFRPNQNRKKI